MPELCFDIIKSFTKCNNLSLFIISVNCSVARLNEHFWKPLIFPHRWTYKLNLEEVFNINVSSSRYFAHGKRTLPENRFFHSLGTQSWEPEQSEFHTNSSPQDHAKQGGKFYFLFHFQCSYQSLVLSSVNISAMQKLIPAKVCPLEVFFHLISHEIHSVDLLSSRPQRLYESA